MRVPVLIECNGYCESPWVRRREFKEIRISGMNGGEYIMVETIQDGALNNKVYYNDGNYPLEEGISKLRAIGDFEGPVNVDLVESNGSP